MESSLYSALIPLLALHPLVKLLKCVVEGGKKNQSEVEEIVNPLGKAVTGDFL